VNWWRTYVCLCVCDECVCSYSPMHAVQLWKGLIGKHESDKRILYDALRQLVPMLPLAAIDRLVKIRERV
jgi:hypothetical protein